MERNKGKYTPDSRFSQLGKDALTYAIAWVVYFFVTLIITSTVGSGDATAYKYVCGLPLWYFLFLVLQIAFMAFTLACLVKKFADIPLDADDPNYDYNKGVKK